MIPPGAVDLEIGAGEALALEAVALEQGDRGALSGMQAASMPMQPQRVESRMRPRRRPRASCGPCRRAARPSNSRASPPARRRGGCRRASGRRADVRVCVENQEGEGFVARHVLGLAAQAAAKRRAREIVVRPGRLPRRQEVAALLAQSCDQAGIVRARRPDADRARRRAAAARDRRLGSGRKAPCRPHTPAQPSATCGPVERPCRRAPIAATVGGDLSIAAPARERRRRRSRRCARSSPRASAARP